MPTDISVAFIKQFESEVHIAYQQTGTLLRNTVRVKSVKGKDTTFQIIGKGAASTKTRHKQITAMNLEHSNVTVSLADYYAGEWVDKLDELKTNIDERQVVAKSGAYALGRKTDDLIIAAMNTTTTEVDGTTMAVEDAFLKAFADMNDNEVPDDNDRYCAVSPQVWNMLLKVDQFAKSNFVDDKPWIKGRTAKKWLGINFIMHAGLPKSGNVRSCFMYHKSALGFANGCDVTSDITWHGDYAAHFINNMMSQGAGLIDTKGVIKVKIDESATVAAAAASEE